jgi:hypothetical protein
LIGVPYLVGLIISPLQNRLIVAEKFYCRGSVKGDGSGQAERLWLEQCSFCIALAVPTEATNVLQFDVPPTV